MLVIEGRNINDVYARGLLGLKRYGVREESRNGPVLVAPAPVMSIYHNPCERVLFDQERDANPFFHLMEAIWMFAGRDDAAFLNRFVKDFGSRFAEEDGSLWGAYGRRWRGHFVDTESYSPYDENLPYLDQIKICVDLLKKNPNDRRVVISMWDPTMDLDQDKRDVPCNTQLYPRIVDGALDLTIMCRSNDIIWGAYGANAVHFSFLQEAMAAGIGCKTGIMYQLSNNWHGYLNTLPENDSNDERIYQMSGMCNLPLVDNYDTFYDDCRIFCEGGVTTWTNSFFWTAAGPMLQVHKTFKENGAKAALDICKDIGAPDWRLAATMWLQRRVK